MTTFLLPYLAPSCLLLSFSDQDLDIEQDSSTTISPDSYINQISDINTIISKVTSYRTISNHIAILLSPLLFQHLHTNRITSSPQLALHHIRPHPHNTDCRKPGKSTLRSLVQH